jgi:gluconokinase
MIAVLMGISGSGKTTLGLRLASDLGWRFIDANDFQTTPADHSGEVTEHRTPVPDAASDVALHAEIAAALSRGENVVLADAALTEDRRRALGAAFTDLRFVHLKGNASLLRRRLRNRSGHVLAEDALAEQFAVLEEPEDAIAIDIDERPGRIVERIRAALGI